MHEWTTWRDPDLSQGIATYAESGLSLRTPEHFTTLTPKERLQAAQGCTALLQATYNDAYPLDSPWLLANTIASGDTMMFTLVDTDEHLLAMSALARVPNTMDGSIKNVELNKSCKATSGAAATVTIRHLLKYRLSWALAHMPNADFLSGMPRAATHHAQSIWWGGLRHGTSMPLIATNVGWQVKTQGIEPLDGFTMPLSPLQWAAAVRGRSLYVPDKTDKQIIDTLITEGTRGFIQPNIHVTNGAASDFALRQIAPGSPAFAQRFIVTDKGEHLKECNAWEANALLPETISQHAVIEADIAGTPQGAAVMRRFHEMGWTLSGWQPSEIAYGSICPVFMRLNPYQTQYLMPAVHYSRYFDEGGLPLTRQIITDIYEHQQQVAIRNLR